jgi:hypothetical protein
MAAGIPDDLRACYNQLLVLDVQRHLPGELLGEVDILLPSEMAGLLGLAKRVLLRSEATPEECLNKCRQAIANAPRLRLSPTMKREIDSLIGG